MFDKSALVYNNVSSNFPLTEQDVISSGDYYFYNFLNSKVKLTDLGLYVLETLRGEQLKTNVPPNSQNSGGMMSMRPSDNMMMADGKNITSSINLINIIGQAIGSKVNVSLSDAATTAEASVGNNSHAVAAHIDKNNGYF
jgi:hypothetical protein